MYEVPEEELVREVVFALQGVDGAVVRWRSAHSAYEVDPRVGVTAPQRALVARLCEAADDAAVRARALCRRRRRVRAAWQYVKTHELELWLGAVRLRWLLRQSVGRAPSDDDESVAVMQSLY